MRPRTIMETAVTREASIGPFAAQLESQALQNVLGRHTQDSLTLTLRAHMHVLASPRRPPDHSHDAPRAAMGSGPNAEHQCTPSWRERTLRGQSVRGRALVK